MRPARRPIVFFAAALALAGCASSEGVAIDLTLHADCLRAPIDQVTLTVNATPALARPVFSLAANLLFPSGTTGRVGLLLPRNTRAASVIVRVYGNGVVLGSVEHAFTFNGAARATADLTFSSGGCGEDGGVPDLGLPDGDSDGSARDQSAPDDLGSAVDLAGADLTPPLVTVSALHAGGRLGSTVYEGEGSQEPSADEGVPVLANGHGFYSGMTVSSTYAEVGAVHVNASGTQAVFGVRLKVDPTLAAGQSFTVPISVGGADASFLIEGLAELSLIADTAMPAGSPLLHYSSVALNNHALILTGTTVAFMRVTGPLTGGTVKVVQTNGAFVGCIASPCDGAKSGPGFGAAAAGPGACCGGGGGGYEIMGNAAAISPGAGGAAYGDTSIIGLPGGSGGGVSGGGVAGGAGGGALRVQAGFIKGVVFSANGANGGVVAGQDASGGGSGGSLLVQSNNGFTVGSLSALGGLGGGGTDPGGAGAEGRIRLDVGIMQDTAALTMVTAVGYIGATIAADWPVAWAAPPSTVMVICGNTTQYVVEVDGVAGAPQVCSGAMTVTQEHAVALPAITTAGIHRVCARLVTTQTLTPAFADPYAENLDCRSIAVLVN